MMLAITQLVTGVLLIKKRMDAAEKRSSQTVGETHASGSASESVPSDPVAAGTSSETPRKILRSRTGLPVPSTGSVLPPLCIICKKVDKIITVEGKRKMDKLSQAETLSAG